MEPKRIIDVEGKEFIRIQKAKTKPGYFDIYIGPEKIKTIRHSKPVKVKWWHAHRLLDEKNLRSIQTMLNQVLPKRKR